MKPTWEDKASGVKLYRGDCVEVMGELPEASVDSIVCDPPYGLEFMGKEWDKLDTGLPQEAVWKGRRGKGGSSIGTDDSKPASRHHVSLGVGKKHAFKRCTECGKRQFSGSPCKCDNPQWAIEYPEGPPSSSLRAQRWHLQWSTAALRVAKPGAFLLAFGGSRTSHRLVCAIEDAGWEVRDGMIYIFGQGFPKSHDVGKALDKSDAVDVRRKRQLRFTAWMRTTGLSSARIDELTGTNMGGHYTTVASQPAVATREHFEKLRPHISIAVPSWVEKLVDERTVESENFKRREVVGEKSGLDGSGFGNVGHGLDTTVIPITAPATDAAKLFSGHGTAISPAHEPICVAMKPLDGTFAANAMKHGVAGLAIDKARIPIGDGDKCIGGASSANYETDAVPYAAGGYDGTQTRNTTGRWPKNVILSDDECVAELFPETATQGQRKPFYRSKNNVYSDNTKQLSEPRPGDSGSASRYFYTAKAGKAERRGSLHPTVKPLSLIEYLCTLTMTPTGGVCLDCFLGSGTCAEACIRIGRPFIGIELDPTYFDDAVSRVKAALKEDRVQPTLFDLKPDRPTQEELFS